VFTLQVLTGAARRTAFARTAQLVAPGCRLLVIAGARDEHDDPGEMPWPLTRAEVESFGRYGLSEQSIVDFLDDEDRGLVRRWRAWFAAPAIADLGPGQRIQGLRKLPQHPAAKVRFAGEAEVRQGCRSDLVLPARPGMEASRLPIAAGEGR